MTDHTHTATAVPTIVNPSALPDPTERGYSTAVVAPAGCKLAFISGQGGFDQTGALPDDFGTQVDLAYQALLAAVEGLGAGPEHVVKVTLYVVDHDPSKLGPLTAAVMRAFGDWLPTQTLVGVPALAVPGMLFEVEAFVALA